MELNSPNMHKTPPEIQRSPEAKKRNPWDCSVCTFKNTAKAFKCKMCESWKSTSSRRQKNCPRQAIQLYNSVAPKPIKKDGVVVEAGCEVMEDEKFELKNSPESEPNEFSQMNRSTQKLDNVNGTTAQSCEETVGSAKQAIQTNIPVPENQIKKDGVAKTGNLTESKSRCVVPRLKNVDRSSAQTVKVTVRNVTVLITEFKPLIKKTDRSGEQSNEPSNERQS